ncbi:MAG: hypothetical protein PHF37_06490 [Phycisphaerae bacterium]|nr:hypothetical protein [Phycisphaerae bacterium]
MPRREIWIRIDDYEYFVPKAIANAIGGLVKSYSADRRDFRGQMKIPAGNLKAEAGQEENVKEAENKKSREAGKSAKGTGRRGNA